MLEALTSFVGAAIFAVVNCCQLLLALIGAGQCGRRRKSFQTTGGVPDTAAGRRLLPESIMATHQPVHDLVNMRLSV